MLHKFKQVFKSRFAKSATVLAGGTALGQALVILSSPLITRLYTPDDFGALAVYTAILGVFIVVATLKYELAIPLPKTEKEAFSLLLISLILSVGMSLIFGIILWLLNDFLLVWTNTPALQPYLWLIPIGTALAASYQSFNYWAIRQNAFPTIAKTKLYQSVASILTQLGLGVFGFAPTGLILGQIMGQTAGTGTLMRIALRGRYRVRVSLRDLLETARAYSRFPKYSSGAAFLNALGLQLPLLLLASFFGTEVAGIFLFSQKLVGLPMVIVASAITQVYVAELASRLRKSDEVLLPFYLKTLANIALLAALIMLAIAIVVPFFGSIFGTSWQRAGVYTALLLPLFYMRFLSGAVVSSLDILGANRLRLWREVLVLGFVLGALIITKTLFGTDISAVAGLSLAGVIAYSVTLLMVLRTIQSRDVNLGDEANLS